MRVALSASGDGARPSASSRARTKKSIGLRHQARSLTAGTLGRTGGTNAQCSRYSAPCSTHALSRAISSGESDFLLLAGGMRSSGSSAMIR